MRRLVVLLIGGLVACGWLTCSAEEQAEADPEWTLLFDGKTLDAWAPLSKGDFTRPGKVHVKDGCLVLEQGEQATGVRWKGEFPKSNYELALQGKRIAGEDFFCGLTFPVADGSLTLIMGGWGGWVVGLSCIDGRYAINNDTCRKIEFKNHRWYEVRVRVRGERVQVWVDDNPLINFDGEGYKLAVSEEMQSCLPIGIATWKTGGAVRGIRYRQLD